MWQFLSTMADMHRSLALGLYKCWTMGILPTGASDWLQFETRPDAPEWSAIRGMILGR
jgi:hypothetical protein